MDFLQLTAVRQVELFQSIYLIPIRDHKGHSSQNTPAALHKLATSSLALVGAASEG